jgi:hypothetical protein
MSTQTTRRVFVNFSTRIDLETNGMRERIESVWALKSPDLLKRLFQIAERTIIGYLTPEEAEAYKAGTLERDAYLLARHRTAEPQPEAVHEAAAGE